jgi:uncharacterized protein DUF998
MKQLTTLALISIAYFVVVVVILHFLRPDVDPLHRPTSEYAVGRYGFLMTTAFLSMSVASLSLLVGLYRGISSAAQSRIGLFLLGVWGAGVLVAMSFHIDPEGTEQTLSGIIHRINGPLIFLSLTIGVLLISKSFSRDANWRTAYRYARPISLIMFAIFLVTVVNVATGSGFEGLCQRVFLLTFVAWFILTALRLRLANRNK